MEENEIVDENLVNFAFSTNRLKIKLKDLYPYLQKQLKSITIIISFLNEYSDIRAEGIVKWSEKEQERDYIYC